MVSYPEISALRKKTKAHHEWVERSQAQYGNVEKSSTKSHNVPLWPLLPTRNKEQI